MSSAPAPKVRPAASNPRRFESSAQAGLGRDGRFCHPPRVQRYIPRGQPPAPDKTWAAALGAAPAVGAMYVCLEARMSFPTDTVPKLFLGVLPVDDEVSGLTAEAMAASPLFISAYGVGRGPAHAHDRAPAKRAMETRADWRSWRCLIGIRVDADKRRVTIIDHLGGTSGVGGAIRISNIPIPAKLVVGGTVGKNVWASVEVKSYDEPVGMS